ncbi:MAG TPA: SufD family Fe-S cluster assembly protein [Bacillota bacterium]
MSDSLRSLAPAGAGLNDERFAALLSRNHEPDWSLEQRRSAWQAWQRLELPNWKYTDPNRIDLSGVDPFVAGGDVAGALGQAPAEIRAIHDGSRAAAGLIVQSNAGIVHVQLDPELKRRGVILTDTGTAVREHPELLREYFWRHGPRPDDDRFLALHAAWWQGGFFLYVPPGVEIEAPIYYFQTVTAPQAAAFPHNLIVADRASVVTVFEEQASTAQGQQPYVGAYTEMYLNDGAQLQYYLVERWGTDVAEVSRRYAFVGRDARFTATTAYFGAGLLNTRVQADLIGQGGFSEILCLVLTHGRQHLDIITANRHAAAHTTGEMVTKQVLRDESRTAYQGLIVIEQSAPHSQDFLQENALILDDGARADAIPSLEIMNDEVAATHGATIGKVDATQLFYLMSRGLTRRQAELMIVSGFFEPLLRRVPGEDTRQRLTDLVVEKVTA